VFEGENKVLCQYVELFHISEIHDGLIKRSTHTPSTRLPSENNPKIKTSLLKKKKNSKQTLPGWPSLH
jgi:hypothetical protein